MQAIFLELIYFVVLTHLSSQMFANFTQLKHHCQSIQALAHNKRLSHHKEGKHVAMQSTLPKRKSKKKNNNNTNNNNNKQLRKSIHIHI